MIYLIRHGESASDIDGRICGAYDDHPTEKGRQQASVMAEKLANEGITRVYHSPLKRALTTATILAQRLGVPQEVVSDLREQNHSGVLTGLLPAEARVKFPEEMKKYDAGRRGITGREPDKQFEARVFAAFDAIISATDTVAIVSHGGPMSRIIERITGERPRDVHNCAWLKIASGRIVDSSGVEF